MQGYLELFRGKNILIALFAMFLMLWLLGFEQISAEYISGAFIVVSIMIGANVLNDIQDFKTDMINRPERPLVSGRVSVVFARWAAFLSFALAMVLSFTLPAEANGIVLFATFFLVFYTSVFKVKPLLGNLVVATISALLFIYSGAILGNSDAGLIPAILAFFIHLIREVVKDLEDVEGDRQSGMTTLAIIWEDQKVRRLLQLLSLFFILFLLNLIYHQAYGIVFAIIIAIAVIPYFVFFIYQMSKKEIKTEMYHRHSQYLKIQMFVGLISMGVGNCFMNF